MIMKNLFDTRVPQSSHLAKHALAVFIASVATASPATRTQHRNLAFSLKTSSPRGADIFLPRRGTYTVLGAARAVGRSAQ